MSGKMIVLEGLDGSGKATQAQFLYDRMKEERLPVLKVSFPNYGDHSAALVRMYLSGQMGRIEDVNVYGASTFFTVDRYATYQMYYKKQFETGSHIIADRYTTSNIVYQAAKLRREDRAGYIDWIEDLEFTRIGLPRPDRVVYLDMAPDISRRLLEKRYGGDKRKLDLHESNSEYLLRCRDMALFAAERCGWRVIQCGGKGEQPLNAYDISQLVWEEVKDLFE